MTMEGFYTREAAEYASVMASWSAEYFHSDIRQVSEGVARDVDRTFSLPARQEAERVLERVVHDTRVYERQSLEDVGLEDIWAEVEARLYEKMSAPNFWGK